MRSGASPAADALGAVLGAAVGAALGAVVGRSVAARRRGCARGRAGRAGRGGRRGRAGPGRRGRARRGALARACDHRRDGEQGNESSLHRVLPGAAGSTVRHRRSRPETWRHGCLGSPSVGGGSSRGEGTPARPRMGPPVAVAAKSASGPVARGLEWPFPWWAVRVRIAADEFRAASSQASRQLIHSHCRGPGPESTSDPGFCLCARGPADCGLRNDLGLNGARWRRALVLADFATGSVIRPVTEAVEAAERPLRPESLHGRQGLTPAATRAMRRGRLRGRLKRGPAPARRRSGRGVDPRGIS